MLKFIENGSPNDLMLQFIINLLYLGMKSNDCYWAEANGTESAVRDLLSTVSDSFISTANDILVNGSLTIDVRQRRFTMHVDEHIDVEEYRDIVDTLRAGGYLVDFSQNCKLHFERLTRKFSVHEDLSILR